MSPVLSFCRRIKYRSDGETATGFLLQQLPAQLETDKTKRADQWQHFSILAGTLTHAEQIALSEAALLKRLFVEDAVELFPPKALRFACTCSRTGRVYVAGMETPGGAAGLCRQTPTRGQLQEVRDVREATTLATVLDRLSSNRTSLAVYTIAMRIVSMTPAKGKDGSWEKASRMELISDSSEALGPSVVTGLV